MSVYEGDVVGHRVQVMAAVAVATLLAAGSVAQAQTRSQPPKRVGLILQGSHLGSTPVNLAHPSVVQPVFGAEGHGAAYVGVEITRVGDSTFAYYDVLLASGAQVSGELHSNSASGGYGPPPTGQPGRRLGTPVRLTAGRYVFTLLTATPASVGFTGITTANPPQVLIASHPSRTVITGAEITATASSAPYQQLPITIPTDVHGVLSVSQDSWSGTETLNYNSTCLDQAAVPIPCTLDPLELAFAFNPAADPGTHQRISSDTWSGHIPIGASVLRYYSAVSGTMQHRSILAIALA